MISPGRFWRLLRRDFKRGLSASHHHYRTLPQILKWSWAYWGEKPNPAPVHLLTGANDWLLAAWMLASLFHYSGQSWRIVVHDDGTLPEKAARILTEMFVSVRFIWRAEADLAVERALTPFPFCLDYRRSHPLALKIFDMPLFTESDRFLVLDSDLLFFARPEKLIQWSGQESEDCWFNEDVQENALVSAAEAAAELGVKLWPRVNSGLGLVARSVFDLDFCDRALARTTILRGEVGRVEQTLFALCASRHGKGGLLPKSYEVSLHKHAAPGAISRHYVGAVRDRFYGEGLKRLRTELLLPRRDD